MAEPFTLLHGDALTQLAQLAPESVDALVCDPPAGISFMSRGWDSDRGGRDAWIAEYAAIFRECLRVLKPGAHGLVWALPRTAHWTTTALEDAGFTIRDVVLHLFGTGFPKSLDVSKAIDATDRIGTVRERSLRFTAWIRSIGLTAREINDATDSRMGSHYTTEGEQPEVATRGMFELLRPLIAARGAEVPSWIEELVEWRTVASANLARREVVGSRSLPNLQAVRPVPLAAQGAEAAPQRDVPITRAHTPEAKAWEGWGTALKPAAEHWILVRKPLIGTVAENVLAHGTGALNVDGCRIGSGGGRSKAGMVADGVKGNTYGAGWLNTKASARLVPGLGRWWPANVTLDEEAAAALDAQSGVTVSRASKRTVEEPNLKNKVYGRGMGGLVTPQNQHSDSGGASRFFYVAKPGRKERDAGCGSLPAGIVNEADPPGSKGASSPRAGAGGTGPVRNTHPTVKGIALMRWLVRLVTPPAGLVLDPFTGSGSTGVAALAEGARFLGVEREAEYVEIARARLEHAAQGDAPERGAA